MPISSPVRSTHSHLFTLAAIAICLGIFSACSGSAPSDSTAAAPDAGAGANASEDTAVETNATPVPPGSCGLVAAGETVSDEEAIQRVLHAEGELVVAQEIDALMALWDADGTITDAKNTPDDGSDDQVWTGRDAIRHRYVRIVFPGAPGEAQPADLQSTLVEGGAVVTATTQIGSEVSPLGDRWELMNQDGCWLLSSLIYNLEAQAQ